MTANAVRAAVLARALRAGVQGDRATLQEVFTDDVRAWTPALSTASLGELLDELDRRDDTFSDVELDLVALDVGGDYACVEWTAVATPGGMLRTNSGDAEPAPRVTLHGVTVAEFEGDRICALRQYWDELAVLDQLGTLASEGADS
jgi:hypothetical protein